MSLSVAHVLNSPGRGGVPRVVQALLVRQCAQGISPHVYFLKPGPADTHDFRAYARTVTTSDDGLSRFDVVGRMSQWLRDHRVQVLHTHSYRPNLVGRVAGALLRPNGLRIVSHYHNFYDQKWQAAPDDLALERSLIGVSDHALAVSVAVKRHVCEHIGLSAAGVTVVSNGVDRGRLHGGDRAWISRHLGLAPDTLVVGLVGRVCRQKGVDSFVDAALMLAKRDLRLAFVVVGANEDKALAAALREKIAIAGLSRKIHLLPHRDQIADVYAGLDMLCVPSRWEGFGLILVEAMHLGIPIIASRVGAIPEVVGDSGAALLVPPDDPRALADAVEKMAANKSVRAQMSARATGYATRFDWDNAADNVLSVYQEIMDRP